MIVVAKKYICVATYIRLVFTVVLGYLGSRKFVPDTWNFKVIF